MSHSSDRTWPPYRDDYPFAMSGAHRKPAYQIGCPSISWHAGFWRSSTSDVRSTNWYQGESRREGDQWILCIEQQILNIYKNLKEQKRRKDLRNVWRKPSVTNLQHIKSPGPDEVYLLRNKYRERSDGDFERINQLPGALGLGRGDLNARYETAHVFGVWDSLPLDIRFEVTSEFYTITTTIDFSRLAEAPNMPIDRRRRNPGEFDEKFEIYKKLREAMCAVIRATNERRRSRKIKKVGGRAHRDVIFTEKARFLYFDQQF